MAGSEETARLLGRVSIFSGLTPEQLADLASVAVPRRWGAGEVIFREGDAGDTCYVVQDGCVRVTRNHTDGRTITLAELRSGDLFGELAMFDSEQRSATVLHRRDGDSQHARLALRGGVIDFHPLHRPSARGESCGRRRGGWARYPR